MNLSKSKIFLALCLGLIAGVYAGKFLSWEIMGVGAMIFVILGAIAWQNKTALLIAAVGLTILMGAARFKLDFAQNDLSQFYNQSVSGTAVISEEPDVRQTKVFLTVGDVDINGQKLKSKILFNASLFPEYTYGQKVSFYGKLVAAKDAQNPGDFSYKDYLSRYGIDALIYYPKLTVIGTGGNPIKAVVLKIKEKWVKNVGRLLPEPQNAFLGGLLLGAKRAIPQYLIDAFNATGTSHVIAVSGYNITIIAAGVDWLLRRFLRRRISFILSLLVIVGFVVMTGASASVVRAGIMGALALIALNLGRLYAINNALAFTAALMLFINPQILHFDVGFQLSFAALLGLIYFTPLIEPYFTWVPKFLREYFLATISAQVFALPILLLNFGILSLIAPVANILILPFVPITMLFGFLSGLASFIWSGFALPFVWISWLLLTYMIKVTLWLSSLPFASISVVFGPNWFLGYYLVLGILLLFYYRKQAIKNFFKKWKAVPSDSQSS